MKKNYLFAAVLMVFIVPVCMFSSHPAVVRWLFGSSRVLSPPVNAEVFVDDSLRKEARCFQVERSFDQKQAVDRLIVYLPVRTVPTGRTVLIIDKKKKEVGVPNTSIACYDLLFKKYLFQGGGSEAYVSFADEQRGWGHDPQLSVSEAMIQFRTPAEWVIKGKEVAIKFR